MTTAIVRKEVTPEIWTMIERIALYANHVTITGCYPRIAVIQCRDHFHGATKLEILHPLWFSGINHNHLYGHRSMMPVYSDGRRCYGVRRSRNKGRRRRLCRVLWRPSPSK